MLSMMKARLAGRREDEDGFTLIELMVVVLIIAILIAIAIPTFLGARQKAQDRAAQSNLRNALTAEKVYYTDVQVYGTAAQIAATDIEKSLNFVAALGAFNAKDVRVDIQTVTVGVTTNVLAGIVCLTANSQSSAVFGLKDISAGTNAGTWYSRTGYAGGCTDATDLTTW
jgi:type IV pilus assembly protein PilA